MASGSWQFSTNNKYVTGRIRWSSTSNGAVKNSSNITIYLDYKKSSSSTSPTYGTISGYLCGTAYSKKVTLYCNNTYVNVASKTTTVNHSSDGSGSVHITASGGVSGTTFSGSSTDKWVTLDKIARYTSIKAWSVVEVGKTYAKLKWQTADIVDWLCTYLNNSSKWTNITSAGGISSSSGTFAYTGMDSYGGTSIPSVSTLKPNTKYAVKLWVRRKDSQLGTYSSNIEFTTSPVARISNLTNGFSYNIGDDLTLNFSNSTANKSWLSLSIKTVSGEWEEVLKTDEAIQSDSFVWQLSNYSDVLYSKLPTRNSAECRIKCGTTIVENGKTINYLSNDITGTINVINSAPIFEDFDCGDEDSSVQKILKNPYYMLQNYGAMTIRIPPEKKAIALNGASIVKYCVNIRDAETYSYDLEYSDTEEVVSVVGNFKLSGKKDIAIYAVDSRGNNSSVMGQSFYVLDYTPPQPQINLGRLNDYENEIVLDFSVLFQKVQIDSVEKNSIHTITYKYYEIDQEIPDSYTAINGISEVSSSTQYLLTFKQNTKDNTFGITGSGSSKLVLDNNKTYNFIFSVKDSFLEREYEIPLEQGIPIMFIGDNGQVSINMIPDINRNEKFQVNGDIMVVDESDNKTGVLERINDMCIYSEIKPDDQVENGIWCKTTILE